MQELKLCAFPSGAVVTVTYRALPAPGKGCGHCLPLGRGACLEVGVTVFCLRKRICSSSKFQRLRELKWIPDDLSLEPRVLVQTGQHGESSLGGRERREKAVGLSVCLSVFHRCMLPCFTPSG